MPGLIRWRHKDLSYPRRTSVLTARHLPVTDGGGGRSEVAPITSRRQTMAKNGPGVALNRPQDTERYNAKDSIVRRAVKCFCLVSKTKWATLSVVSLSFGSLSSQLCSLRPRSSPRYLLVNSMAVADLP